MTTVKPTLTGLNASLLVRNPVTRKLRVNYDPKIRETLHEAEYLMKLNLDIGPFALNLCMSEDHLKTTRDSLVN
jgi:Dynein heavy chain, N-terminal region 1